MLYVGIIPSYSSKPKPRTRTRTRTRLEEGDWGGIALESLLCFCPVHLLLGIFNFFPKYIHFVTPQRDIPKPKPKPKPYEVSFHVSKTPPTQTPSPLGSDFMQVIPSFSSSPRPKRHFKNPRLPRIPDPLVSPSVCLPPRELILQRYSLLRHR